MKANCPVLIVHLDANFSTGGDMKQATNIAGIELPILVHSTLCAG